MGVEWGLIAALGIPACSILAFMAGRVWESLGNEVNTPE